jgi:hypothetical protein
MNSGQNKRSDCSAARQKVVKNNHRRSASRVRSMVIKPGRELSGL